MGWIIQEYLFLEKMEENKRSKRSEPSKLFEKKVFSISITLTQETKKERRNLKNVMPFITSCGIAMKRFTPEKKKIIWV